MFKKRQAALIEAKIEGGMATKKDKEWLRKYKEKQLKIKK